MYDSFVKFRALELSQNVSLKPCVIVCKCRRVVKFPIPGETACIADLECSVCRRKPTRSSMHQLFCWPRKKWPCSLSLLTGSKDVGEGPWSTCKYWLRRGSGHVVLWGCQANMLHKLVNICTTIFFLNTFFFFFPTCFFFAFLFSLLPFLSGRLLPSITSPWAQVALTRRRKPQQRCQTKEAGATQIIMCAAREEEQQNNWHPAHLGLLAGAASIRETKRHCGNTGAV